MAAPTVVNSGKFPFQAAYPFNCTGTFDATGCDTIIVVWHGLTGDVQDAITCTFAGKAGTLLGKTWNSSNGTFGCIAVWMITGFTAGSGTLTITKQYAYSNTGCAYVVGLSGGNGVGNVDVDLSGTNSCSSSILASADGSTFIQFTAAGQSPTLSPTTTPAGTLLQSFVDAGGSPPVEQGNIYSVTGVSAGGTVSAAAASAWNYTATAVVEVLGSGGGGGGEPTPIAGTIIATEASDQASFSGWLDIRGTLTASEKNDTASFLVTVMTAITGALAASEASDRASVAGGILGSGTLAASEQRDSMLFSGGVTSSGTITASELPDVASIVGGLTTLGSFTASEASDIASALLSVVTSGVMAASETPDRALFTSTQVTYGPLAATEDSDAASFLGSVSSALDLIASENPDAITIFGQTVTAGPLAASEDPDLFGFSIQVKTTGSFAASEPRDQAHFDAESHTFTFNAVLKASEEEDKAAMAVWVDVGVHGPLAATEDRDQVSMVGFTFNGVNLLASEQPDRMHITAYNDPLIQRIIALKGLVTRFHVLKGEVSRVVKLNGKL